MSTTQINSSTKLGATGPEVFPIALGCMAMSGIYGKASDDESIATIHEAVVAARSFVATELRCSALTSRGTRVMSVRAVPKARMQFFGRHWVTAVGKYTGLQFGSKIAQVAGPSHGAEIGAPKWWDRSSSSGRASVRLRISPFLYVLRSQQPDRGQSCPH
jgi:hypothetical protein